MEKEEQIFHSFASKDIGRSLVYFWPRANANEIGTSECYLIKVTKIFEKKPNILRTPAESIFNLKIKFNIHRVV